MTLLEIPLKCIVVDLHQPRTAVHEDELVKLAESIAAKGLLLPLRVRQIAESDSKYVITSGHRRYAALQLLGKTSACCLVGDNNPNGSDILEEQLVENLQRSDLTPLDEARGYERYLALKQCTASVAAKSLAISPARISRALALLTLPDAVQSAVRSGQLSADAAYYLTRLPSGRAQTELIEKALQNKLSRDEAARAVKLSTRPESTDHAQVSRVTCKLPQGRTLTLSGEVINLETLIEILEDVLRDARKARSQNWDVTTLAKVFRDRATAGGAA